MNKIIFIRSLGAIAAAAILCAFYSGRVVELAKIGLGLVCLSLVVEYCSFLGGAVLNRFRK